MNDQANTTDGIEAQVKGCIDRHKARGEMSMDDQFYLLNAGIPPHAPIPDDVAAQLPSKTGKGTGQRPDVRQFLGDAEISFLTGQPQGPTLNVIPGK